LFLKPDCISRRLRESAAEALSPLPLDHDDFGSNRSKIMNVIDSKSLERDAGEKVRTLFLIPL
jgi:hypothetical protein